MEYRLQNRDNYDRSLKVDDARILLYSKKKYGNVAIDGTVVGEVLLSERRKPGKKDDTIKLGDRVFSVKKPGTVGRLLNKTKGYIAVDDDAYITVYQSRVPFLIMLFSLLLVATLAVVLILTVPHATDDHAIVDPVNPLPVIDPHILRDDTPVGDTDEAPSNTSNISNGGGSVKISFRPNATLVKSTGEISMGYTNPKKSTHDVVIELYVVAETSEGEQEAEYLIAKSGRIPHGNKLTTMTLLPEMAELFGGEGIYKAKYKVLFYNPETGELALVNNELTNISLTVSNT